MQWIIRTATYPELEVFQERVVACLQFVISWFQRSSYLINGNRAAAMATGCEYRITYGLPYYDLHQNLAMGKIYAQWLRNRTINPSSNQ